MLRLILVFLTSAICILPIRAAADSDCAADAAGCCCRGTRGNVDCDYTDNVDIADLSLLIDYLFISLAPLPSIDEANVDGEGGIDISDLSVLIDGLFINFRTFPPCPGPVNHPPVTLMRGFDPTKLRVNPPDSNGPLATIDFRWGGNDQLDHPYEPSQLSYEWRLYGPYDSATYASIREQFERRVFVTTDGQMYVIGQGNKLIWCDTVWSPDYPPFAQVICDTMLIDTVHWSDKGRVDTVLDVESPTFAGNPAYNRLVTVSGAGQPSAVVDTMTRLYDLFRHDPNDTTVEKRFIFWVRTRDPDDTTLFDPVAAFQSFKVFDPKFERDILIADAQVDFPINPRIVGAAQAYWNSALTRWKAGATVDLFKMSQMAGITLPMKSLLQHKVTIVVNDDAQMGLLHSGLQDNVVLAMSAGAGIWLCGRNQFSAPEASPPNLHYVLRYYGGYPFGMIEGRWSGWNWYALKAPPVRIEDFCGALSVDTALWPDLLIDTAYLHSRYVWDPDVVPWMPALAALPEVNSFSLFPQAEVLYTYKSIYNDHHPLLPDSFFYAGQPVVYRLQNDSVRLFVSAFTPYAFADDGSPTSPLQTYVDSALNWLMAPFSPGMMAFGRRGRQ
ncbi:MAG: hypothetical protein HY851_03315 [candidate division Zixibacteria bacterium]|nr:hypothetical protein [candidate division Zixibacteria bacterium]